MAQGSEEALGFFYRCAACRVTLGVPVRYCPGVPPVTRPEACLCIPSTRVGSLSMFGLLLRLLILLFPRSARELDRSLRHHPAGRPRLRLVEDDIEKQESSASR
jgi:hypothetical protein